MELSFDQKMNLWNKIFNFFEGIKQKLILFFAENENYIYFYRIRPVMGLLWLVAAILRKSEKNNFLLLTKKLLNFNHEILQN